MAAVIQNQNKKGVKGNQWIGVDTDHSNTCYLINQKVTETDIQQLEIFVKQNPSINRFIIFGRTLTASVVEAVAKFIAKDTRLKSFEWISITCIPQATMALMRGLTANAGLDTLVFNGNFCIENEMETVAKALTKFRSVDLSNKSCFNNKTAKIFFEILETNKTVIELKLNNSSLAFATPLIANALEKNITLKVLELNDNNMSSSQTVLIAKALAKNNSLTTLTLMRNCFDKQGISTLVQSLQSNPRSQLITLDLGNTCRYDMPKSCMSELFTFLATDTKIQKLNVASNCFGSMDDTNYRALAKTLQSNTTLQLLDVRNCLGDEQKFKAIVLPALENNETITEFLLDSSDASEESIRRVNAICLRNTLKRTVSATTSSTASNNAASNSATATGQSPTILHQFETDTKATKDKSEKDVAIQKPSTNSQDVSKQQTSAATTTTVASAVTTLTTAAAIAPAATTAAAPTLAMPLSTPTTKKS